jgi:hypothetical protein
MAEIPVERKEKSAFPWWLIPLLLLLPLLGLLYYCNRSAVVDNTNHNANRAVIGANANNNSVVMTNANYANANYNANANLGSSMNTNGGNVAVVTNANNMSGGANMNPAASGDTVTAVNYFGTVKDKSTIVGRNVDLASARVNRVLSDRVFTVKSEGSDMYVMLDESLDSPGGKEGQIKIRPGQNIKLGGSFRNLPSGEVKNEAQNSDLSQKEYARMKGQQVYLHATSVSDVK